MGKTIVRGQHVTAGLVGRPTAGQFRDRLVVVERITQFAVFLRELPEQRDDAGDDHAIALTGSPRATATTLYIELEAVDETLLSEVNRQFLAQLRDVLIAAPVIVDQAVDTVVAAEPVAAESTVVLSKRRIAAGGRVVTYGVVGHVRGTVRIPASLFDAAPSYLRITGALRNPYATVAAPVDAPVDDAVQLTLVGTGKTCGDAHYRIDGRRGVLIVTREFFTTAPARIILTRGANA